MNTRKHTAGLAVVSLILLLAACGGGTVDPPLVGTPQTPGNPVTPVVPTPDAPTPVTPTPPSDVLGFAAIPRQALQAGQKIDVPLSITAPPNGATTTITVDNPAPEFLTVTVTGSTLTLQASADAPAQGLIPVKVTVSSPTSSVAVRVPVEIGDLISREYARFNALRTQANIGAVPFDENASMNCWLHGRYTLINKVLEHTEDLSRPFATLEGRDCASRSNISNETGSPTTIAPNARLPLTDVLFAAPFHTLGMIRNNQVSVGIGLYSVPSDPGYTSRAGGITSIGSGTQTVSTVMFPGAGATTDLSRYSGGESPDPFASCPGFDRLNAGLPIVVSTGEFQDTTAENVTLTEDGVPVTTCAFGSTQYVNTTGGSINYITGPVDDQVNGRRLLKGYSAVFIIPQKPLNAGKTYAVSLKINGQPLNWSFRTAATLQTQSLQSLSVRD